MAAREERTAGDFRQAGFQGGNVSAAGAYHPPDSVYWWGRMPR